MLFRLAKSSRDIKDLSFPKIVNLPSLDIRLFSLFYRAVLLFPPAGVRVPKHGLLTSPPGNRGWSRYEFGFLALSSWIYKLIHPMTPFSKPNID